MVALGFEPLVDCQFSLDFDLRLELQGRFFSHASRANDVKYYHWMYDNKIKACEETGRPLRNYNATFVSHILSRGAYPEIRYDGRNANLLWPDMHEMWEIGDRTEMNIWLRNKMVIEELREDYQLRGTVIELVNYRKAS